MRYLYVLIYYLALPLILLHTLWRSWHEKGYRHRLYERFGYIKTFPSDNRSIWLHAVSIGEVITVVPLVKSLLKSYPHYFLMITTTTPAGALQIRKNFKDDVHHVYLPYDLPGSVNRFLTRIRPRLAILIETELWPNLLHYTHKRNIPILLANARLSERSFRGYQKIASIAGKMLRQISCVAAQSPMDGDYFVRLGLPKDRLLITGNIKFDLNLPLSLIHEGKLLRKSWGEHLILITASTHEREETFILETFRRLRIAFSNALLILVPRHPSRFPKVARLCESAGFSIVRRSLQQLPTKKTDIILGDTIGELCLLYAASDVAFVGGSLVPVGGHNLIEPAAIRLPIITGSHLQNFVSMSKLLKKEKALVIVKDSESFYHAVARLFKNPKERSALGERAYQVSISNTGATSRHMRWINAQLLAKLN